MNTDDTIWVRSGRLVTYDGCPVDIESLVNKRLAYVAYVTNSWPGAVATHYWILRPGREPLGVRRIEWHSETWFEEVQLGESAR